MGPRPPRPLSLILTLLLVMAALPLAAFTTSAALPDVVELPRWAVGFHWTYHFEGETDQEVSGFRATYLNDTYTSEVVGETTTSRGDAWVVRNAHAGTMSGEAPGGIPATADFTSLSYYAIRKYDLAVLNFTQDLNITTDIPIFGAVEGSGHNETYADPPLAQIAYGAPADGTRWHVYSNLTSTGWFKIGSAPQFNTSTYLVLDYNLSVAGAETVTVPAGAFEAFNITGGGTADFNGTVYNFTQAFAYAPRVLANAVDEAGYLLVSFYVNRAPVASALPALAVAPGGSATLDLAGYFSDPDGDSFALACVPATPLNCSVAPNRTLTVSADDGVNATLALALQADDGFPAGNATFDLVVLVSGPGNPNTPPDWWGPPILEMQEDMDSTFRISDYLYDPDDANLTVSVASNGDVIVLSANATSFTLHAPPDWYGSTSVRVSAYDGAGNSFVRNISVEVSPVNDPPTLAAAGATDLFVHTYQNVTAAVTASDVDGGAPSVEWTLDGVWQEFWPGDSFFYASAPGDSGVHTLAAVASDGFATSNPVTFTIYVFVGPTLASHSPAADTLRVANGSTVEFEVVANDPDTPVLNYTWTSGSTLLGSGPNATRLSLAIAQRGPISVLGVASDNGSFAGFQWFVIIEDAPPGLVALEEPLEGAAFDHNATANVSAAIDPRLSNVSVTWKIDGAPFATTAAAKTPRLEGPGNYTLSFELTGLYNATVPYSVRLAVNITVRAPAPPNDSNGDGDGGTRPPPPAGLALEWLLLLLVAAAAGAAGAVLWRRRGRVRPPPGTGPP